MTPYWIVVPYLNCWDMTQQAITDLLAQTGLPSPPQILAIDTGSTLAVRAELEAWMEREPRLHAWFHRPGLSSLSATWNLGLRFVWGQGGEVALVVNNDVRVHPETYLALSLAQYDTQALFVSAVGRREADMPWEAYFAQPLQIVDIKQRGGPDFSCFLITRECHDPTHPVFRVGKRDYHFDEGFIPAYCEDNDFHRQLMLNGDGDRIFSVNLPYLHYGSGTVNADPSQRARWAQRIAQSRAHYVKKWGGDVNAERYTIPFDASTDQDGVSNPELQRRIQEGSHVATAEPV